MYNHYYAERMMAERKREIAEVQLNAQRLREATVTHNEPYFHETTLPALGEARLFRMRKLMRSRPVGYQASAPRHVVRLGRVMIAW